jgi:hypothetical protein
MSQKSLLVERQDLQIPHDQFPVLERTDWMHFHAIPPPLLFPLVPVHLASPSHIGQLPQAQPRTQPIRLQNPMLCAPSINSTLHEMEKKQKNLPLAHETQGFWRNILLAHLRELTTLIKAHLQKRLDERNPLFLFTSVHNNSSINILVNLDPNSISLLVKMKKVFLVFKWKGNAHQI